MSNMPQSPVSRFRRAVFLLTPVSFLLVAGFFIWFLCNLPAGYQWETGRGGVSCWDIAFALLLLANHVLIFLSFLCFLSCISDMLRRQKIVWLQVGHAALGLYPILVVMTLCTWDMAKLTLYFCWPVSVLFLH